MNENYRHRINSLISKLSQDPCRQYSLDELAGYCHTSKFHFHRLFKAITGETVHQLSSRLRLEKAAGRLVYDRESTITKISYDLGFSSSANFTKAFQSHFLCSPSEYRKQNYRNEEISKIGKASATLDRNNVPTLIRVKDIKIIMRPNRRLAYLRAKGLYDSQEIEMMFNRLLDWSEGKRVRDLNEPVFMVNWSDTFIAEQHSWTYDAGIVVSENCLAEDDIQIQTLIGGLVTEVSIWLYPQEFSKQLHIAWDEFVGHWLVNSGYLLSHKPSYEYYGQFNDRGQQAVTLCLPLESN